MRLLPTLLLTLTAGLGAVELAAPASPVITPTETEMAALLTAVPTGHPRLFIDAGTFRAVNLQAEKDHRLGLLRVAVLAQADHALQEPPAQRILEGRRLLGVSRAVLRRMTALGAAFQMTGDPKYAARGEQELQAVCAFSDWHPDHFLDVGEMSLAVAIGYDWLYSALSETTRAQAVTALTIKGIAPSYDGKPQFWIQGENNWTQVCHAGLSAAALAIQETDPDLANRVLRRAISSLPRVMTASFAPDGAFTEGPGYWDYGTSFNILAIDVYRQALKQDFGLSRMPGFLVSAEYRVHAHGPTGRIHNYADSGIGRATCNPAEVWLARERGMPWSFPAGLDPSRDKSVQGDRLLAFALLWSGNSPDATATRPLDWHGNGIKPVAFFRSAWGDPMATWLGVVAGSPHSNHSHMDAGSFVFEALGVRWSVDLGSQSYNDLESKGVDLWNMSQNSQRWTVLRQSNLGHSTLVLNGQLQQVAGMARFTDFSNDPQNPGCTVDLSSIYGGQATAIQRRFRLPGRQSLIIEDRLTALTAATTVRWQLVTGATVTIQPDGRQARLTQGGNDLDLTVTQPETARLVVSDAAPRQSYDAPNPGIRILAAEVEAAAGSDVTLEVHLDPVRP